MYISECPRQNSKGKCAKIVWSRNKGSQCSWSRGAKGREAGSKVREVTEIRACRCLQTTIGFRSYSE